MATVTFSGIGSGIDFDTIRDAIIAQRTVPISRMQAKVSNYSSRIDALKQLNASVASLATAAENLTNRDLGTGRSAVSGDATVAVATATDKAALGNFSLNVTRLATTLSQATRSYAAKSSPVLADGATTATFELRKGDVVPGIEVKIDETNNTLEGLRDAINSKNAGVTASIVDLKGDGTQQQLVLTSKETGVTGSVELVETSATGTGADLNLRTLNPPDGDLAKLDAEFSVGGLTLTRSSNTISDAVEGLNFTLKKAGTSSFNITQSNDVENKLKAFVNAYNSVQDFVAGQYQKDSKDRPTGVLAGDATFKNIQRQLKNVLNEANNENGGKFTSLSQIGITTTDDGHLTFDSAAYNEVSKNDSEDIRALLFGKTAAQTGVFQNLETVAKGLSDSVTGSVQTSINGYQSSVKSINDSITNRLADIGRLRDSLTRKFSAADAAIGQLNSQQTSLTSIIKSLSPKETY